MSDRSAIEWTDATWNPIRGCSPVSPGCENCFAARMAHRFSGPGKPYEGLTKLTAHGPKWTGDLRLLSGPLDDLHRWRKPRRIFVCSMSDVFHELVPDDYIDEVLATTALCTQHTFQILTKRATRMREYLSYEKAAHRIRDAVLAWHGRQTPHYRLSNRLPLHPLRIAADLDNRLVAPRWPLPNVHLGVSAENQEMLDKRLNDLVWTPAARRFLSLEPLLGPIDLRNALWKVADAPIPPETRDLGVFWEPSRAIHHIIVGGESGPGARSCDVEWIRSVVQQCKAAGVPVFVKQLGANVRWHGSRPEEWPKGPKLFPGYRTKLQNKKGSDPAEWPEDLRVREQVR